MQVLATDTHRSDESRYHQAKKRKTDVGRPVTTRHKLSREAKRTLEIAGTSSFTIVARSKESPREIMLEIDATSTEGVYIITICQIPTCTCPAFTKIKAGTPERFCKHLFWVLLYFLRVPATDFLLYQVGYTISDVEKMIEQIPEVFWSCMMCFSFFNNKSDFALLWLKKVVRPC